MRISTDERRYGFKHADGAQNAHLRSSLLIRVHLRSPSLFLFLRRCGESCPDSAIVPMRSP
jgi:hypothetical protein